MQLVSGNPNILQSYETFEDDTHLHMIVELCSSSGNLFERINNPVFTEWEAARVMVQLLEAVSHCHKSGVAHRDIKVENILFDSQNRLKLADFGLAECFKLGTTKITENIGTLSYAAPEVLSKSEYDEKVDVWSCGVLLYVMLTKIFSFLGDSRKKILIAILKDEIRFPINQFKLVSQSTKDLIMKMLCRDPSRRPSAEQVLRHPWIITMTMKNGGERSYKKISPQS